MLSEGEDWVYIPRTNPAARGQVVARDREQVSRIARPLQAQLRNLLISQHGRCQVTGTECPAVLEACHIEPVRDGGDDSQENALLLRRDIHALFDAGLLKFRLVSGFWTVEVDSSVFDPMYAEMNGKQVDILGAHARGQL